MRYSLFAAASLFALVTSPALAQTTIDDEQTEPVETANADGEGNADDIVIASDGRVTLIGGSGPAVRINSNNSLTTNSGSIIQINDRNSDDGAVNVDGATGLQIASGSEFELTHSGRILLTDSDRAVDSETDDLVDRDGDGEIDDPDGEADGPFAQDQNKTGILIGEVDAQFNAIAGQDGVTGNINMGRAGSITVHGQNSFGLRSVTDVDGNVQLLGPVNVIGENSRGVSVEGNVTGNVQVATVGATAPGGSAVVIEGDVGGGVRATGAINATGYRTTRRFNEELMALFENEVEAAERDDVADNLDSGSALLIAGSVNDGVFIANSGSVSAFTGSGAAIEIRPDQDASGDVVIGEVSLPDDFTSNRTDDDDEGDTLGYAVVTEGNVLNNGVFDGKNATAFLMIGRNDNGVLRSVILESGGIWNARNTTATAYDAKAIAIHLGEGVQADTLRNTGSIVASASLGHEEDGFADDQFGNGEAIAIQLDQGSQLRRILNEQGGIVAQINRGGQRAVAIMVGDNSLEEIRNTGNITAQAGNLTDDYSSDDIALIAIDARNNTTGLNIVQEQAVNDEGEDLEAPSIVGDVLLGDGDDRLELLGGSLNGDVSFGDGADVLIINNASLNGAISDSDGDLLVDVTNGRISLTGADSLTLRDAIFRNGGVLEVTIDDADRAVSFLNASGDVTFEEGAELSVDLANLIGQGGSFEIISAGTLTFANEDQALTATEAPYLYNASFERDPNDADKLTLTLEIKTTDELGMNANQAAAFDEAMAAFEAVEALGAAIAGLRTSDAFFGAYDQLLPEYAASAIQFALASNDAAAGALEGRLRNARMAPDDLAGIWVQQFGYFANRSGTAFGPGYRGQGVGVALGIDRPAGPFYAVGVKVVGAASEVEETDGFDDPMVALTGQVGAYAAMDMSGFDISGSIGLGYDYFETERQVRIGDFTALTMADWNGWHATASLNAGRDFTFGRWVMRPEGSLSYVSLFESGYEESTTGVNADDISDLALIVDDRESSVLLGAATFTLSRQFGTEVSWWAPSLRVGYRGEFANSGGETTARFGRNGDEFTLQAEELANSGVLVGMGLTAGSQYSTFTFAYDADVRDDFIRHVARLVIRLTF